VVDGVVAVGVGDVGFVGTGVDGAVAVGVG